ncbi:MAG: ABC transporter permease [Deltaproteobacteria bacterium HGW-Deltaproteobacteria-4]|nr:MAG: ABC transporter permease [Deltaproteobacteria bacterium HGW-Deltaproteobacteria-4]
MNRNLERQRNILDFTLASLERRRGKNLSLLLIYSLVIFLLASVMFFTAAIKNEAASLLADAPDMVVQRLSAGRHALIPLDYISTISEIRGVRAVAPRLWGYYFDPVTGANYTVQVPDNRDVAEGEIVIGAGIARSRGIEVNDFLSFRSSRGEILLFPVSRLLSSESELVTSDLVLISENDFRALFNLPTELAVDLAVSVANQRELITIAEKIIEHFPDSRPILKNEILRTYDAIFDWRSGMMVVLLLTSVCAFLIFAWDKASGLSAEEKREIGILKSVGWETSDVLLLKFWEGASVSLCAFLIGVIAAYGHVYFFSAGIFEPALKGWAVIYPEFRLIPRVEFDKLATLFFLTTVPYTLATIIPSWRAATIDPDAALRQ